MIIKLFTQHEPLWDPDASRAPFYQKFAQVAWNENKKLYCDKYEYKYHVINVGDKYGHIHCGYIKILEILHHFENNPDVDWAFWIDCDTLITNFKIRIEDILDNNYHVVVANWFNEVNNGVFAVRNTVEGRRFLKASIDYSGAYQNEQQIMAAMLHHPKYTKIDGFLESIKVVPQRTMNSGTFEEGLYPPGSNFDLLGNDAQWQVGDYIIHYPGLNWDTRYQLMLKHFEQVIYE